MSTVASKYECLGCGIARRIGSAFCDNPDCDDADPFGPGRSVVDTRTGEATERPTSATPHFYRRHTPLVGEVDAMTGYDSAGLFQAFQAAIEARHDAKRRISIARAHAAKLAAKFDSRGNQPSQADRERKSLLAELMEEVRTIYYRNPLKEPVPAKRKDEEPTEKIIHLTVAEVESRAKAHPRYQKVLQNHGEERKAWEDAKAAIDDAWAEYEQAEGIVTYLDRQLEDRKSLIYYASKEFRHSGQNQT